MAEDRWPNLYNSKGPCVLKFSVHNAQRSLCNHHRSIGSWGSGVLQVPQLLQGRGLVGVQGAKPLETLRILYFTVPEKELKTRLKTISYHGEILPVL